TDFLIDTHAHLDFYIETPTERDEVLRRAYASGVQTILAIGIGDGPDTQHLAFVAQMYIAAQAHKPILIHCRTSELATPQAKEKFGEADAWEDLLRLIDEHWTPHPLGGIMHCFSGTIDHAQRSLNAGFHLSFAGNLTYPKSQTIREAAIMAPADRILIETDPPFLPPLPLRGQPNQ